MDVGTANDTGGRKLAIGSDSVVDTLFNVLLPLFVGLCVLSLFCKALLTYSILSSFAIILTRKRELVALF